MAKKKKVDGNLIVKEQQLSSKELTEKKEQLDMMIECKKELQSYTNEIVGKINDYIYECSGCSANRWGRNYIKSWIKKYSYEQIIEAIEIAFDTYYDGTDDSWEEAFNKIGGICKNHELAKTYGKKPYYYNYILKVCRIKFCYWSEKDISYYVMHYIDSDDDFNKVKLILKDSISWSGFKENMESIFS